jgi:hypothetical protein
VTAQSLDDEGVVLHGGDRGLRGARISLHGRSVKPTNAHDLSLNCSLS